MYQIFFMRETSEWKNPWFNFTSQNLGLECNLFKWDGKETKKWPGPWERFLCRGGPNNKKMKFCPFWKFLLYKISILGGGTGPPGSPWSQVPEYRYIGAIGNPLDRSMFLASSPVPLSLLMLPYHKILADFQKRGSNLTTY